jgi:hypothetical protein
MGWRSHCHPNHPTIGWFSMIDLNSGANGKRRGRAHKDKHNLFLGAKMYLQVSKFKEKSCM